MKYKSGDVVEVEIWNPDLSVSEWKPGIFQSYISAIDRPYRLNVEVGRKILKEVAPECVRKKKQSVYPAEKNVK